MIREDVDVKQLPPIIVVKKNQVLLTITSRDFGFVTEDRISDIYELFHKLKIKINLMQNAAISFSCCIDNSPEKIETLIKALHDKYKIGYNEGLELLTVRYNKDGVMADLINNRTVLLEQRSPVTIQALLK